MKRILHIISQYPGHTGSGIYLQALIMEGNKKGYSQRLVVGAPKADHRGHRYIDDFYPVKFNTKEI